jgi:Phosphopantetheine attachment site
MAASDDWREVADLVLETLEQLGVDTVRLDLDAPLDMTEVEALDLAEVAAVARGYLGIGVDMAELRTGRTLREVIDLIQRKR